MDIYFDNVLIDSDAYAGLENTYKLFTDNFYLGSTASNTFKITIAKTAVSSHPSEVKITDDTNTYYLIVDKIYEEKNFYVYDLVDKLVLFNFNYNAKTLIDARAEDELTTTLSDILADMCTQAGVTLDSTLTLINDIEVDWYDNTILARDYLSYIAELQGGFARILDDGKLTIVGHKMASQSTIQIDNCEDFVLGEKKTISRVVYDDGINVYEYGDETANTLYINPSNVYITDTTVVSNIYDEVVGLEFYLVETGKCRLDPSVRAGDIITFTDGINSYLTIAGYSASFGGGYWLGNYSLNVASKQQEETQVKGVNAELKSIKTIIDRTNASLSILASSVESLEDFIKTETATAEYIKLLNTPLSNGAIQELTISGFPSVSEGIHRLYPGMSFPGQYTYPGYLTLYTLIFDSVSTFDATPKYVYVYLPVSLTSIGTVKDEISIVNNQISVIQKIGWNETSEEYEILSTPITHINGSDLLPTFDGDTYIKVLGFGTLTFDATYMQKNSLTNVFATQLESSAILSITNDAINTKVSKDRVISEINQSAEKISISAEKVSLEGYTTINDGFSVDLDGNATMNNATINGSTLKLADNTEIVGGNGILTNLQYKNAGINPLGFRQISLEGVAFVYGFIELEAFIPANFTVREAYITLTVYKTLNQFLKDDVEFISTNEYGKVTNIKLYKVASSAEMVNSTEFGSFNFEMPMGTEIPNAFAVGGYTNPTISGETVTSIDIKNSLSAGINSFYIATSDALPGDTDADATLAAQKTQLAIAILTIIGFTK